MPKIPTYQQKIGVVSGPISPRASAGAFTQVGKAYAQLGTAVQQAATVAGEFELARQNLEAQNVLDTKGRDALDTISKLNINNEIRTLSGYEEAFDKERQRILGDVDAMEGLQPRQKRIIKSKLSASMDVTRANESKRAFSLELGDKTTAFNSATEARLERLRSDPSLIDLEVASYEQNYDEVTKLGLKPAISPAQFRNAAFTEELVAIAKDPTSDLRTLNALEDRVVNGEGKYSVMDAGERVSIAGFLSREISSKESQLRAGIEGRLKTITSQITFGEKYVEDVVQLRIDAQLLGDYDLLETIENDLLALSFASEEFGKDGFTNSQVLLASRQAIVESIGQSQSLKERSVKSKTLEMFDAMLSQREDKVATDPAAYVFESYEARGKAAPSADEVIAAQKKMGVSAVKRKVLTNAQAEGFVNGITSAETPQEMSQVINSIPELKTHEAEVVRHLLSSGLTTTHMYILSNPESPSAQSLLNSMGSEAVANATKAQREMVVGAVIGNDLMNAHLKSMAGSLYIDALGGQAMASGVDSSPMARAREGHINMIADFAIYLARQDKKVLGKDGINDISSMTPYVEQAVAILDEKYAYADLNQGKVRMPKRLEPFGADVKQGLKLILGNLDSDLIVYNSLTYEPGSPEYIAERNKYVEELVENFSAITQNGDSSVVITDKTGGAVMIEQRVGFEIVQVPLTASFVEAVDANSTLGRNSIKVMDEQSRKIGTELKNNRLELMKTEEGRARIVELEQAQQELNNRINARRKALARIGM